jgi:hypothetical protein
VLRVVAIDYTRCEFVADVAQRRLAISCARRFVGG